MGNSKPSPFTADTWPMFSPRRRDGVAGEAELTPITPETEIYGE